MKYLKRFNEELKPQTYKSAAYKLKKMGQLGRAGELTKWAKSIESKESIEKWKKNIENMSKYGVFNLTISNEETGKKLVGDFYLELIFDSDAFADNYECEKADSKDPKNMKNIDIYFFVGIIPINEELLNKCIDVMKLNEFDNGFYWGMVVKIGMDIVNDSVVIDEFELDSYDESMVGKVVINDRASAGRFKTLLKNIFSDPMLNYPSGRTDVSTMWNGLERSILIECGFSSEYGFELTDVAKFINGVSANKIVKEI